ncbi:MAG: hypothetical protein AB2A00_04240 [Myxococcota bacterium]
MAVVVEDALLAVELDAALDVPLADPPVEVEAPLDDDDVADVELDCPWDASEAPPPDVHPAATRSANVARGKC